MIRPSRRILEAVAVCGLLAAAGVLFSRNIDTAPSYDEGVYLASLDALRHGQTLGSQVFASQPPGFYLVLRLVALPFGDSISGIRTGFLLVALGGCLAAYLLGRRLSGPAAGLAAAALIAVAPPFPSEAPRVEADVPSVALALASLAVAAYAFGRGRSFLAALAGGLLAAAVSVKFLAVPAVVPFVALAFAHRATRRQIVAAALGALVVVAVLLALYAGVLGELWDQAVRFHDRARSYPGPSDAGRLADFFDFRTPFSWLAGLGLVASLATRRVWPLWLFPAAAVAFLLWEKPLFEHHLVLLSAAVALPAGLALGALVTRLPHRLALGAAGTLVAALALGLAQQVRRIDYARVATTPDVEWGVAAFARCTSPGELVASDQPIVAFRAHRQLPGELVDTSLVRVETNSLTPARVLELVDRDHISAVFVGRAFADEPDLVAGLRSRFPRRLHHGEVTLYLSGRSCS